MSNENYVSLYMFFNNRAAGKELGWLVGNKAYEAGIPKRKIPSAPHEGGREVNAYPKSWLEHLFATDQEAIQLAKEQNLI